MAPACSGVTRRVFTSVPDLGSKLRRYINPCSANSRPIQWKYSDPVRPIRTNDLPATAYLDAETETEALWSSQANVIVPLPLPSSLIFHSRFSTIAGGLLMVMGVLPRSWEPS